VKELTRGGESWREGERAGARAKEVARGGVAAADGAAVAPTASEHGRWRASTAEVVPARPRASSLVRFHASCHPMGSSRIRGGASSPDGELERAAAVAAHRRTGSRVGGRGRASAVEVAHRRARSRVGGRGRASAVVVAHPWATSLVRGALARPRTCCFNGGRESSPAAERARPKGSTLLTLGRTSSRADERARARMSGLADGSDGIRVDLSGGRRPGASPTRVPASRPGARLRPWQGGLRRARRGSGAEDAIRRRGRGLASRGRGRGPAEVGAGWASWVAGRGGGPRSREMGRTCGRCVARAGDGSRACVASLASRVGYACGWGRPRGAARCRRPVSRAALPGPEVRRGVPPRAAARPVGRRRAWPTRGV
jgi:hypothetical protein